MAGVFPVTMRTKASPPAADIRPIAAAPFAGPGLTAPRAGAIAWLWLVFLTCLLPRLVIADSTNPPPAVLKISGYGFFGNRELARMLRTLELGKKKPAYFGAGFVEDAALILTARVKRDGYLRPRITATLDLADGGQLEVEAADLIENPLPRPLHIAKARFRIYPGVLYHYKSLTFSGLEAIPDRQARSYFMETDALFHLKGARVYTPDRLQTGLKSLTDVLERRGYHDATVVAGQTEIDDATGAARIRVAVRQGPRFSVHSVRETLYAESATQPVETQTEKTNQVYSRLWTQDFAQTIRTNLYAQGYPDASVVVRELSRTNLDNRVAVDLQAEVRTGQKIRVGTVRFEGEKRTRPWLLRRRARIQRGELLNPVRAEQGRYRLAELGTFDSVDLSYQPVDENTRDVLYRVKEGKRFNVSLLFGYGSYELLRGGVEADMYNIWGLGHRANLKAVQSFKSSSGDFTYTMPELVGKDVDLYLHGFGLLREEVSFTREEYGGGLGLHRYFKPWALDASGRYTYQVLNALDIFPQVASEGLTNPAVGSILLDLRQDRRDNPLYPRQGYKVFSSFEVASDYLGGEANYERIEVSPSWYHPLGGGSHLSLGLSHGVAISAGSAAANLPFNKRFFPGGNNSLRGYQEGEASPRNAEGQFVGAETYSLATVELEQSLTPKWSVVVFSDSLGFAHHLDNYPFDTGLFSVGGGLRWKTIIGPVRLEYGHNLNPRKGDPSGTLHFALGFPF